jgi:hypothetical protein
VPIYKKGKTFTVVVMVGYKFSQFHTILFSVIFLSRLSPYTDEVIGYHRSGFQCNRSTTDQISCIHQILGEQLGVK